jgi:AcrR family transcriptional regulator
MKMSTGGSSRRPYTLRARADAAEATGQRILEAAWEQFGAQPFDEVRMQGIADAAEVTVQTIHTRFGGKADLVIEAYKWWGRQEVDRRDASPAGDVAAAVTNVFDHYEAHGRAILTMLSQEDRVPNLRSMTDYGRDYHLTWVRRVFEPQLRPLTGHARKRALARLAAATDVLVWRLLRLDMHLARTQAELTVVEMIEGQIQG